MFYLLFFLSLESRGFRSDAVSCELTIGSSFTRALFLAEPSQVTLSSRAFHNVRARAKLNAYATRTWIAERNRLTYECHHEYHWPRDYWLLSGFSASQDTAFMYLIVFASHLAGRFQFAAVAHISRILDRAVVPGAYCLSSGWHRRSSVDFGSRNGCGRKYTRRVKLS